ncbi:hypothetical protein AA0313_1848 [Acetobacter indonesiensis NRIC 0313]|uniref:Uncharacterized protein n=1 Tax=Acetobacter indonesiensis TaxID=104101 RepID=A0A6N3T8A9_9PROT|nr:hypothetical protein AA0313_1848 [Acetobacter indonesiensis NRIC 0313]GEN04785.1 hypothetical protein AIN02nite_28100 [Acetobacter indonesiensis]
MLTYGTNTVGLHHSPHTTLTNIKSCFSEFHGHPRTAIGPVAQGIMLADICHNLQIGALLLAHGPGKTILGSHVSRPAEPDTDRR